jgi:NADH:ubiquinone oxidoreductase subunit 6 (subunit J)
MHELPGRYFRRAAPPTVITGILVTALAAWVDGFPAAAGALLGAVILLGFFGTDLLAMRMSADWEPVATFGVVMIEYIGKIVVLALIFMLLAGQPEPQQISTRWLGISLAATGVVFLVGLVVAYLAVPTFGIEPEQPESSADDGHSSR